MISNSRSAPIGRLLALTLLALPLAAQTAEVRVRQDAAGSDLLLGATAFHRTDREIAEVETIRPAGTAEVVVLWTEQSADAADRAFYAISRDGRTMATVREADYEIGLVRAKFDPLDTAPNFSGSVLPPSDNLYIVQFATQPLESYRSAVRDAGAVLHTYLPGYAHVVRMNAATANAVADLPFVRWVGPFHPEYRIEFSLLAGIANGALDVEQRYNIMVFERGLQQKERVASLVSALGGTVDAMYADGFRMEATLSPAALASIVALDEVMWIDRSTEIGEDMAIARMIGGADYIETQAGFTGVGVRGEALDSGCRLSHQEFQDPPLITHKSVSNGSHGTQVTGVVFSTGIDPTARGMLPDGQGIAAFYGNIGNRYTHTAELVNPALVYKAVFQTNSWGNAQTSQYTSISAEMDDIIFINDIVICQSQSNTGTTASRPQAWAKNIVAVGGVRHQNTLTKADDSWGGSASIGPASDGRIKPDLTHFYDNIRTTSSSCDSCYTNSFGGTSGATPITAGHMGLVHDMWHSGIFGNTPAGTVFDSRPHSTTARALAFNTADPYPFSGTGHDKTRTHQGWGMADLAELYDQRDQLLYVDETDVLSNLESTEYNVQLAANETEFRATMVYLDTMGTPGASKHRINNLDLKVTAPDGTVYWGNNGLLTGVWSTPGGSANDIDVVENVFVQNPDSGTWKVEVIAAEINEDTHIETGAVDADYALVVTRIDPEPCEPPTTYCTAKTGLLCGVPAMGFIGGPSASASAGFFVFASPTRGQKGGVMLYSDAGRAAIPFDGGLLCMNAPFRRTTQTTSGGNAGQCDGEFLIDMNAFAAGALGGNPAPFLTLPGQIVNVQWWGRDSAATGSFLSDAIEYTVCN